MRAALGAAAALTVSMLGSCIIDVDNRGKACPCAAGYECVNEVCVEEGTLASGSPCAVTTGFSKLWETDRTIAFQLGPAGDPNQFFKREIAIAASREAIEQDAPTVTLIGEATNPELRRFTPSGDGDAPFLTLVRNLEEDTIYYAQLVTTDARDCESRSEIIAVRTDPGPTSPNDPIRLFPDGSPTSGWAPTEAVTVTGDPAVMEYRVGDVCSGDNTCGAPVKLQNIGQILGGTEQDLLVKDSNFATAYLEVRLRYAAGEPAYWGNLWLAFDVAGTQQVHRLDAWMIPVSPDEDVVIQVPLGALMNDAEALTFEEILTSPLVEVGLSAQYELTSVLTIESLVVRY